MTTVERLKWECPMAVEVFASSSSIVVTVPEFPKKNITNFISEQTSKEIRENGLEIEVVLAHTSKADRLKGNYVEMHDFSDSREKIITEIEDGLPFILRKSGQMGRRREAIRIAQEKGWI